MVLLTGADLSFQPAPYNPERVFDSMDSPSLFQHEGEQVHNERFLLHA